VYRAILTQKMGVIGYIYTVCSRTAAAASGCPAPRLSHMHAPGGAGLWMTQLLVPGRKPLLPAFLNSKVR